MKPAAPVTSSFMAGARALTVAFLVQQILGAARAPLAPARSPPAPAAARDRPAHCPSAGPRSGAAGALARAFIERQRALAAGHRQIDVGQMRASSSAPCSSRCELSMP